jgi:thermostable 8-oxoguanine DNA glycosylase
MKHYIEIKWVKYNYTITPNADGESSKIICAWANISQNFLNEDIPALLNDLKNLIVAEERYKRNLTSTIRFRASKIEKETIKKNVKRYGYKNMSEFLKKIAINPESFVLK